MTRLRRLTALVVAALATASLTSPSDALSGSAPVTAPDRVTAYAGQYVFVKALANDSDPEGDKLVICGLTPQRHPRITADFDNPKVLAIGVGGRAKPGTYVFTYYACDGTSQAPGTVTLVVAEPPKIKVRAVAHAHDKVRATSNAPFVVKLTFGDGTEDYEGLVYIPKRGSVVFTTRFPRLYWSARKTDGTLLARGYVPHIP
jgi:Big-like domain-containing protein